MQESVHNQMAVSPVNTFCHPALKSFNSFFAINIEMKTPRAEKKKQLRTT